MHCCIPTPTTDNNTSAGMIWVTLSVGRSAANRQGIVREFHIVWRVITLIYYTACQLAVAQCSVIGPVCVDCAYLQRVGGRCPNLTSASARAVFASLWALFCVCQDLKNSLGSMVEATYFMILVSRKPGFSCCWYPYESLMVVAGRTSGQVAPLRQ